SGPRTLTSLPTMASSLLRSGQRLLRHHRGRLPAAFSTAAAEELIDVRKLPTDYDPSTFDPTAPPSRPPPSDRVWRLVDDVSALTLAEAAELSALLLRRLDIPSAPPIAILNSAAGLGGGGAAAAGAAGDKPAAAAEKTVFELRLDSFDAASKIKVIKEIRTFTDLGLKEAKELVEKAPAVIKGGLSKEEAEKIVERMKALGAKVVMD
uniref:Large ribosomal subunit protein bL12 C-terminal domain-containing protein n=3 Tax=Triticeae TaxID=147389 RepID=A0A452ZU38_AEGTS